MTRQVGSTTGYETIARTLRRTCAHNDDPVRSVTSDLHPLGPCTFARRTEVYGLARYLDELSTTRPLPRTLVLDNGPEFTSKAMFFWAWRSGVRLHFIQPVKPTRNAFVESFNGNFREYCLDLRWFAILTEARDIIERRRTHYNPIRLHRSVGKIPPLMFALGKWPDVLILPLDSGVVCWQGTHAQAGDAPRVGRPHHPRMRGNQHPTWRHILPGGRPA